MGDKRRGSHVAIYLPSLQGGGAERIMVNLVNAIAERGYPVDLVLAHADGPYLADVNDRVSVIDLKARGALQSLPVLIGYLRRRRPDSVLSVLSSANVVALLARPLSGVKFRLVVSERSTFSVQRDTSVSFKERALHWIIPSVYRLADEIIAVSKGAADDLVKAIKIRPELVTNIDNFIDVGSARIAPNSAGQGVQTIFAAGRLTRAKAFDVLISAFAMLRATRKVRLIIAGEGELREPLEKMVRDLGVSDDVSMPGFLRDPYDGMHRTDLFVLSSEWEGFPNVLLEAMARGARVVSTDCPSGPAEILENGKWGRLVPVGDAKALCKAMAAALDDPSPPDTRQRAAYFSVDRAVDEYLSVLIQGYAQSPK